MRLDFYIDTRGAFCDDALYKSTFTFISVGEPSRVVYKLLFHSFSQNIAKNKHLLAILSINFLNTILFFAFLCIAASAQPCRAHIGYGERRLSQAAAK